jgi:hypothetical protein
VPSTQPTTRLVESALPAPTSSPPFLSTPLSGTSASTSTPLYMQTNPVNPAHPLSRFTLPPRLTLDMNMPSVPPQTADSKGKEKSSAERRKHNSTYPTDLTPVPSLLRPHCTAKDRLYLWLLHVPRPTPDILTSGDMKRVQDVMLRAAVHGPRAHVHRTAQAYLFSMSVVFHD